MSNTRNWPTIAAHSLTIGGKHTFSDWSMIPKEIPVFAPPTPKTNYIDIPGSNGSLDYTEINSSVVYDNRQGSFEFIVLEDAEWPEIYSEVMNFLQGKKLNCILDDDPEYYYTGRFSVNTWKSMRGYRTIVIDYTVDPFKHSIDTTRSIDWLWNELFDNIIYYGTFTVDGSKARNLINPTAYVLTPTFTCSATIFVDFGSYTYTLPAGTTTVSGIALQPGDNTMTFRGTGNVLVDYDQGLSL